jgi:hypothetical protein
MYVPAARLEAVIAIAGRIVVCIMYEVYSIITKDECGGQGREFKE